MINQRKLMFSNKILLPHWLLGGLIHTDLDCLGCLKCPSCPDDSDYSIDQIDLIDLIDRITQISLIIPRLL